MGVAQDVHGHAAAGEPVDDGTEPERFIVRVSDDGQYRRPGWQQVPGPGSATPQGRRRRDQPPVPHRRNTCGAVQPKAEPRYVRERWMILIIFRLMRANRHSCHGRNVRRKSVMRVGRVT